MRVNPPRLGQVWRSSPPNERWLPPECLQGSGSPTPWRGRIAAQVLGHFHGETGQRLPVILGRLSVSHFDEPVHVATELVIPLDPWPLEDAESFCFRLVDAGIGVIPLPVAPTRQGFAKGPSPWGQTWRVPQTGELLRHGAKLLAIHLESLAAQGSPLGSPPVPTSWHEPEETVRLLEEPLRRLSEVW